MLMLVIVNRVDVGRRVNAEKHGRSVEADTAAFRRHLGASPLCRGANAEVLEAFTNLKRICECHLAGSTGLRLSIC
jgi:hypothetical protein